MAHILLIENEELFIEMLSDMLTADGHRLTLAVDGVEGLRLARQIKPDLILTDILMPKKDGIELIAELFGAGSTIPIVAMSGGRRFLNSKFNLDSALLMGVKAILTKPFSQADLRQAIERALA